MSLKSIGVLVVVCVSLVVTGCGQKGSADRAKLGQEQQKQDKTIESGGTVQQTCPVTGNPIDEDLYVDYEGKRIFVADSLSLQAVQNDPEAYLIKLKQMGEVPQPLH
jgi:hypothetical protein